MPGPGHRAHSLEPTRAGSWQEIAASRISATHCERRRTTSGTGFITESRISASSTPSAKLPRSAASRTRKIALAWLLHQPAVAAPIIGASKMQHLDDAVAALSIKLDAEELKALGGALRSAPCAGAQLS